MDHARAGARVVRCSAAALDCDGADREPEKRALSLHALDTRLAAHQLGETAHDRQAPGRCRQSGVWPETSIWEKGSNSFAW